MSNITSFRVLQIKFLTLDKKGRSTRRSDIWTETYDKKALVIQREHQMQICVPEESLADIRKMVRESG